MRALLAGSLALLVIAVVPPPAFAQAEPVPSCSKQCRPGDPDVNNPPLRREGPVNVILYAHFLSGVGTMAFNTRPPDPKNETDLNSGTLVPTLETRTGLGCAQGNCLDFHFRNNDLAGKLCAGPVEPVKNGLGSHCLYFNPDAPLDVGGSGVAYAYLSAASRDATGGSTATVGAVPNVGIRFWITIGTGKTSDPTVAEAELPAGSATLVSTPGSTPVYQFRIPFEITNRSWGTLNLQQTIRFHFQPFQVKTQQADFMQPDWRLRTGPLFPWRVILPVDHPLLDQGIAVRATEGGNVVESKVAAPLGVFDIDHQSAAITITDSEGYLRAGLAPLSRCDLACSYRDHHGDGRTTAATWSLEPFGRGPYTINVTWRNAQGTYYVEQTTVWEPMDFKGEAPGPAVALALVAIGAALVGRAIRLRR